jgi:fucose permease
MSKLHSVYAWGTVGFVITFTLLLLIFGSDNWQWISLLYCIVPMIAGLSFSGVNIPQIPAPEKISGTFEIFKNNGIWLLFFAIFFGGASEVTMAQWSSSYLELSLGLPKVWGDIFGVALFAVMLGLGRTLYSKFGKNICKVLVLGAIGATICYFVAAIVNISFIGLLACGLTGFCTSMMWPGSLIAAADRYPNAGVFIYALMAAGGDLGASLGPQAVGLVTDLTLRIPFALTLAETLSLTPEQLGMKLGLLVGMLFPLIGIFVYCIIMKWYKKVN